MQFYMNFILIFGIAFAAALLMTPVSIKLANKLDIMDVPKDNRRIHKIPIPRFGGLAIFCGVTVSVIVILVIYSNHIVDEVCHKIIKVLCVGAFVYLLGVLDDKFNLQPKVKLGGQLIAAIALYALDVRLRIISVFGTYSKTLLIAGITFLITIIWVIGIINTVNLIDGVDGLAAGITAIAGSCIAYVAFINGYYLAALMMLAVAGSAIGFLPFNFNPAKTFMGDSGSMYLGFCLAGFSIIQPVKSAVFMALIIPVFVLLLPIIDTTFAILRRLINKKPIMSADKGHIHHRLMRAGMGQRRTVLMLYGVSGIMGIAAVLFSRELYIEASGLTVIAFGFIYVFLTEADNLKPKVKERNNNRLEQHTAEELIDKK